MKKFSMVLLTHIKLLILREYLASLCSLLRENVTGATNFQSQISIVPIWSTCDAENSHLNPARSFALSLMAKGSQAHLNHLEFEFGAGGVQPKFRHM